MVLLDALASGGRLAIFASGLWLFDEQSQGAAGAPILVHGANTASTARLAVFACLGDAPTSRNRQLGPRTDLGPSCEAPYRVVT